MAVTFVIPGALREHAGNRQEVRLEGAEGPLSSALARLWAECPGIRDRVITERGEVRPHVNIFVDGESIKDLDGLRTPVRKDAEIVILPAVSGG